MVCVAILSSVAQAQVVSSSEAPWWKHAVFYEIYPRSFADSNHDGIGDLNGITYKMAYLKDLGVDAIWISPCYPSPQKDFGYDVSDYENIDPMYGDLQDFDRLQRTASQDKIRIIMDFVPNHTSDQHKWFLDSRSSRSSEHRDWYIWRDGKAAGGPPISGALHGPSIRKRSSIITIILKRHNLISTGAILTSSMQCLM
jgi:alpha-glucosidase